MARVHERRPNATMTARGGTAALLVRSLALMVPSRAARAFAKAGVIGLGMTFVAAFASAQAQDSAVASRKSTTLFVEASGVLPGFKITDAPQYLSARMADAGVTGWEFAPAASASPPANRVEWRFRLNSYAGGSVRQLIPMPAVQRLFGVHRLLTVELRLYLDGEYQTMTFAQSTIQGGAGDKDLAAFVEALTQSLLGERGAYRAIATPPRGRNGAAASP